MTTTRRKYRYRDNSCGVTRISLERMKRHLQKIGVPKIVRGYRFVSTRRHDSMVHTTDREAVLVIGTKGSARFEGLCWGYGGEGPRGLRDLLVECGLPNEQAEKVAFESHRSDDCGTDWEIRCGSWIGSFKGSNESITLPLSQIKAA
jgi:hypothetical protein